MAAVLGIFSLYSEFGRSSSPIIQFEVLSNTPVLNVKEDLPELEVIYRGEDIAKNSLTLSVILIRLANRGLGNLLLGHYDPKDPVGLSVRGGNLIRVEVSDASNSYLKSVSQATVTDSSIAFDPVILESNQWFLSKLLVLHRDDREPTLVAMGKIAGIQEIPVVLSLDNASEGFWREAFAGTALVQLVRASSYPFIAVSGLILIMMPIVGLSEVVDGRRRRRTVADFKALHGENLNADDEILLGQFIKLGPSYVKLLSEQFENVEKTGAPRHYREYRSPESYHLYLSRLAGAEAMKKIGLIEEHDGKFVAVPEKGRTLRSFENFLDSR